MFRLTLLVGGFLSLPIAGWGDDSARTPVAGAPSGRPSAVPCETSFSCGIDGRTNGLAYAGGNLIWLAYSDGYALLKDPTTCNVSKFCGLPGTPGASSELAYDGTFLYHYNFATGLIYKIDPNTCEVLASCDAPGDNLAEGLTWDGQYLWKGDSEALWRFTPPPECVVVGSCPNPAGDTANGLTMCGSSLIMLGYSRRIYRIDPARCEAVEICTDPYAGNGLTSDRSSFLYAEVPLGQPGDDGSGIARIPIDCASPTATEDRSWGSVKALYR